MVLVDSSIWIEHGRRRSPELAELIQRDEVAICPPVLQELLQGVRSEAQFRATRETLLGVHMVDAPMAVELFEEAAQLYRTCRDAGYTIRSAHDCLIAASAIRHRLALLQHDHDFELIARVAPLRLAAK